MGHNTERLHHAAIDGEAAAVHPTSTSSQPAFCREVVMTQKLHKKPEDIIWHRSKRGYLYGSLCGRYVTQHRLVMEQIAGRRLQRGEVVHHKNHIPDDNRPENLEIMDFGEHTRLHRTGAVASPESRRHMSEVQRRNPLSRPDIIVTDVVRLKQSGMSIWKIAAHFNCGYRTIERRLEWADDA